MKKIFSIFAAACLLLTSCQDLSTNVTSLVELIMGNGSDSSDSVFGTDTHFLFIVNNMTNEDIYWFVPEYGQITDELDDSMKEFVHPLASEDLDVYFIDEDKFDPIWTYEPDDVMLMYIFKASVIDNNDWKDVVDNKMWETVLTLTAQDVINSSKVITIKQL